MFAVGFVYDSGSFLPSEGGSVEGLLVNAISSNAVVCCSVKSLVFLGGLFLLDFLRILPEETWSSFVDDRVFLDVGLWELYDGRLL